MKTDYEKFIIEKVKKSKKKQTFKTILKGAKEKYSKNFSFEHFTASVERLKKKGVINEGKNGFFTVEKNRCIKCKVVRLNRTFGFVKDINTEEEYFVSGKFLLGAMPGDIVLVKTFQGHGDKPEGEVVEVLEENFSRFTGNIEIDMGRYVLVPDTLSKYPMDFENPLGFELRQGDKVMAEITKRGKRHSEHKCIITASFGSSLKASVCAMSILDVNNITPLFPDEVIAQAREISNSDSIKEEAKNRLDLRDMPIFTIDGADTKDIDDAVSVSKTENGYKLGVHIADVSHYVTSKSPLDNEAFRRGTSVYYANRVVPMLPKELSNGICSLNPNEDRLAFSCLMELDKNGLVTSYRFAKTVIRSRVKGVYSELNSVINGNADEELKSKYKEVIDCIPAMSELADILYKNRIERGAPQLESRESKLIINEDDICVDVQLKARGRTEEIIEDFMLMANMCAARFGTENGLPFVYRIHEQPPEEKVEGLIEGLSLLNVPFAVNGSITPKLLSGLLEKTKNTPKATVVNNLVLRSMAKAKYSVEPVGHFGLVLDDYAHFTSPIRRYPDLAIHRIMSEFLENGSIAQCQRLYQKFAFAAADQSTATEITAMQVERSCEDCYKAEFLKSHIGEVYSGIIVSVMEFGFFVELPNTCEGLVRVESLSDGIFSFDGYAELKNINTGETYKVGQQVNIKVLDANVSSGKVDFILA